MGLRLDLRNYCAAAAVGTADVDFSTEFRAAVMGTETVQRWTIRGRVRRPVVVSSRVIDLGRLTAGQLPARRTVPVQTTGSVESLSVTVKGATVKAGLSETDSGRYELAIMTPTGLPPGRYEADVQLSPVGKNGEVIPPVRVAVVYDVRPDVLPDSDELALPAVAVGREAVGRTTLTAIGGRPFRVTGWSFDPPSDLLTVTPEPSSEGGRTFHVSRQVVSPGDGSSRILFRVTGVTGHDLVVPLVIRWYGLAPGGAP